MKHGDSELILNTDGSIYHLHLKPEHIADHIILVGDQGRVTKISRHFDQIEHQIQNREFLTHTGTFKDTRITVLSTGIGTDNIDIVINELDAAVNYDLVNRQPLSERKRLNLIRIGTSGSLHPDVPVESHVVSTHAIGLDGLLHYYHHNFEVSERALSGALVNHLNLFEKLPEPYVVEGDRTLIDALKPGMLAGMTVTAAGFYAPQGRSLYLPPRDQAFINKLQTFQYDDQRIINFEMESSAIYGLGKALGHRCCTCCAILANRSTGNFAKDPGAAVEKLILTVLDRIAAL